MAKNKKKKNKTKDFQKVKFKVGKKKPRGLNETVATFKTRSINIKEQLKEVDTSKATTKRKLNVQELMSQCQHYNPSMRHEGLFGLRELITADHSLLHTNLALIIEKVSAMVADKDAVVRASQCKVFKTLFPLVSSNQIAPFFNVLSAHLCCAMTHIHDDIQLDSLHVLDLCLQYYPSLVTHHGRQILTNFVEQISRQSQTTAGDSKTRMLMVNPNSKLSSQKGRVQVLRRVHKFFQALVDNGSAAGDISSMNTKVKEYTWDPRKPLCVGLQPSWAAVESSSPAFRLGRSTGSVVGSRGAFTGDELRCYAETLVPLLLQCWAESSPAQLATDLPGNALSAEAMMTLSSVLGILRLLLLLSSGDEQITWFREHYLRDFVHYFMPHFPYAMHEKKAHGRVKDASRPKEQKNNALSSNITILMLNLELCHVMSHFTDVPFGQSQSRARQGWQTAVLDFLLRLGGYDLDRDQVTMLISIVKRLLGTVEQKECREHLMRVVYSLYPKRPGSHPADSAPFLDFFADIACCNRADPLMDGAVSDWACSLPGALGATLQHPAQGQVKQNVTRKLLVLLSSLACRKNEKFLRCLDGLLFKTLLSDQDLKLFSRLDFTQQCQAVQLLHWIPVLDKEHLSVLVKFCTCPAAHPGIVRLVMEIVGRQFETELSEKCPDSSSSDRDADSSSSGGDSHDCRNGGGLEDPDGGDAHAERTSRAPAGSGYRHAVVVDFLSFVMSVGLGPSAVSIDHGEVRDHFVRDNFRSIFSSKSVRVGRGQAGAGDLQRHLLVTQECTQMLERCCTREPIESAIIGYVIKFWNSKGDLTLSAAVSIVYFVLSAIRRGVTCNTNKGTCHSDGDSVKFQSIDCSASRERASAVPSKRSLLFEGFPAFEDCLCDVILTVATVLVAVETGQNSAVIRATSEKEKFQNEIEKSRKMDSENKGETAQPRLYQNRSAQCDVNMDALSDDSKTQNDERSGILSVVAPDLSALVPGGLELCRECLTCGETVPRKLIQSVTEKISATSSLEDIAMATGILTQLFLSGCVATSDVQLLQDFVSHVNKHVTVTEQFWSDFVYAVSVLKQ